MQKFFFDMKDGVPMRDKVGIDFNGNLEAIEHLLSTSATTACATIKTLRGVNALGREIHREYVHRQ
jgi:hypothetical protein